MAPGLGTPDLVRPGPRLAAFRCMQNPQLRTSFLGSVSPPRHGDLPRGYMEDCEGWCRPRRPRDVHRSGESGATWRVPGEQRGASASRCATVDWRLSPGWRPISAMLRTFEGRRLAMMAVLRGSRQWVKPSSASLAARNVGWSASPMDLTTRSAGSPWSNAPTPLDDVLSILELGRTDQAVDGVASGRRPTPRRTRRGSSGDRHSCLAGHRLHLSDRRGFGGCRFLAGAWRTCRGVAYSGHEGGTRRGLPGTLEWRGALGGFLAPVARDPIGHDSRIRLSRVDVSLGSGRP